MTNDEYFHLLKWEYFHLCTDKSVLEIGPLHGEHSTIILSKNPSRVDLVDIDPDVCKDLMQLKKYAGLKNIINCDINNFLEKDCFMDVVVCFGLLHHMHSPIRLLELIVNSTRATYVMMDGPDTEKYQYYDDPLGYNYSAFNSLELERKINSVKKRRTNLSLMLPYAEIARFMDLLGYRGIKHEKISVPNFWKDNFWIGIWERQ